MAVDLSLLGKPSDPREFEITAERAIAYAEATNDRNPRYLSGELAPPVFAVVPAFEVLAAQTAGLIPAEMVMFIVHGEQDMHFHQPVRPGQRLSTTATPMAVRVGGSGTRIASKAESVDADGRPVVTQWFTTFVRGMADGESAGPDKPEHDFPDAAREKPFADPYVVHVDDDQTYRYKEASGDPMPIHVDDEFAKSVGLPGIIAHGLCTMAMCSQAVVHRACDGDPTRLARLAVRFAANVFPGNDVEVQLYEAGGDAYAFEATSAGATVIKHGRAEVR
jgi:acyl dehydratase